ncbi:MAG: aspartate-semialdehyde dehydrogenase [Candidatus Dormibacteria bacterium]
MWRTLLRRGFPVREWRLLASERSAGQVLDLDGRPERVCAVGPDSFDGVDVAFFSAGAGASHEHAPVAARAGATVIDNSSAWRMDPGVPLVVPEVNPEDALTGEGIIANPNCSTIQLVVALKPLHDRAGLRRVVVDTYQSASGAGRGLVDELDRQNSEVAAGGLARAEVLAVPLAGNVVPQIDVFVEGGHTREEVKVVNESRKILHLPDLRVTVTCARVPVRVAHSEAVHIEFDRPISPAEARQILATAPGVTVVDDPDRGAYPIALQAAGQDDVFVGRIREDQGVAHGLSMWIVADNLLKGAALNAVQIAEWLHARGALSRA